MRSLLIALLLAAPVVVLPAAPAVAEPVDRPVVLPDGRVLNLYCQGKSGPVPGPVVVLDSGWAADSRAWRRVLALLPDTVRACAVDRAGQGKSSAGPMPRDGAAVATDLHAALTAAKLPGPWLLVGHSLGGLNMRHFARLYPAEVAGLLLVDPTSPTVPGAFAPLLARSRGCVEALKTELKADAGVPVSAVCRADDRAAALERWEARLSEIESAGGSTSAGLADQGTGSLTAPLIVLRPGPADRAVEGFSDPLAALSAKGEARLVPGSGHMIMIDRPEAVAGAIMELVAMIGNLP
ncbi:MAG: hypothetical protein DI568_03055 [Sphingomonas sp.]|nr:MAG: hypothetical protein DI568_03055 [Sphingomonas sp.]